MDSDRLALAETAAARARYRVTRPGTVPFDPTTLGGPTSSDVARIRAARAAAPPRELPLPFAPDDDSAPPPVHVAVDASGELVAVLRRDGAGGLVHDLASATSHPVPDIDADGLRLCALAHAPHAVAWWPDRDGLSYVALDLCCGAVGGPWWIERAYSLVIGPDDAIRMLRRSAPPPPPPPPASDDVMALFDELIALADQALAPEGPWQVVRVDVPGTEPVVEHEVAADRAPEDPALSPDGRWLHDRPTRMRREGDLRLVPAAADGAELILDGTDGLRVALVAFAPAGDAVLVAASDRRQVQLASYALPSGERRAEASFDAPLFALWPLGGHGVAASWVDELLVWRDPGRPDPPLRLSQPGGAGLAMDLGVAADPTGAVVAASDGATLAIQRIDQRPPRVALPHDAPIAGLAVARVASRVVTVVGATVVVTAVDAAGAVRSRVVHQGPDGGPTCFGPGIDAAGRRFAWCLGGAGGGGAACVEDGAVAREVAMPGAITAVAVHPTGELLAVASGAVDTVVTLLRWADLAPVGRFEVENTVYALAFSGDGARLAVASRSGELALWDLAPGVVLARAEAPLERLDQLVADVAFDAGGAAFLPHAGAVHRRGADGAVALAALALDGAPFPSPGGRFVACRVERHRVRVQRLDAGGTTVAELLVEFHGAALLLADGRVVTVDTDAPALCVHAPSVAADPAPPAALPPLSPIAPGASWATVDAAVPPPGVTGQAAHHWRALRRQLEALAPSRGHDAAEVEALAGTALARLARLLVAMDAMSRILALLELGDLGLDEASSGVARHRGPALTAALAARLPRAGRFIHALRSEDLRWSASEQELVAALLETPDGFETLSEAVDALAEQYAFEVALTAARDVPLDAVAALSRTSTVEEAMAVAALDLASPRPAALPGLLALSTDPAAPRVRRVGAALMLDLREESAGTHLAALPYDLHDQAAEMATAFIVRCIISGLLTP